MTTRKSTPRRAAPRPAQPAADGLVTVTVTPAGAGRVADGEGGWCEERRSIAVVAETAAALKARGYAA